MNAGLFTRRNGKAAKLTLDQVGTIRRAYDAGATQGELARHFGVTIGTIGRVVRGETWVGQARPGEGTQAEIDESKARLARMLGLKGAEELGRVEIPREALAKAEPPKRPSFDEIWGAHTQRAAMPPSPLDGGDAPSEGDGTGLQRVQEVAAKEGLDVELALKGERK